jgi:hypothetical protein
LLNQRQGANTDGFSIETKTKPKPNHLNAPGGIGRREPFLFEQRKGSANMQDGDSTAVAARGIDRRRVWDRVDGGDKEQQANQANGTLEFQSALKTEETAILAAVSFHCPNILHLIWEGR